jgi:acyl-CoA synthetase (AMP-forming)/AMP-acid ligase II
MNIAMILEMAAANDAADDPAGDRQAVTADGQSVTATRLHDLARATADRFRGYPAVLYTGTSHLAFPVAMFGAALAAVPFVPLSYRLGTGQLASLLARHPGALLIGPADLDPLLDPAAQQTPPGAILPGDPQPLPGQAEDPVALLLYTSGTTADPKAALLRHRHLLAYILNTVDFGSAAPADASLVAVPPYHIAGVANLLTSLYSGRRVVYLPAFTPAGWLAAVRQEHVSHALLVPTMLARIVAHLGGEQAATPTLRTLAYGGARTPRPVLEQALRAFPGTGFVNAYGLTETASSVTVLEPHDHRAALESADPRVRARLGSAGRAVPGVELQVRADDGSPQPPGTAGLVFVRGDQIAGEYRGQRALDPGGWFATRDRGWLDDAGYLFIEGRADDTIIRGGENIAPAEIEDVLLACPGITEAAVLGLPDPEWGQRLVAVVVGTGDPEQIRDWVRGRLRSARTPDTIVFRAELPRTDTGKLLRRTLLAELETTHA